MGRGEKGEGGGWATHSANLAVKIVNLVSGCRSAALCATINMSTDINVFYLYFTRISLPFLFSKTSERKKIYIYNSWNEKKKEIILSTWARVEYRNIT